MTRVLVTGGAGFIGSHFIRYALRQHPDWQIVNLDKLSYAGNPANLESLPDPKRHTFVKGDIVDAALVTKLWSEGFDIAVNFAAETHVDRAILQADDFIKTDVLGAFTLLEAARQFGVKRFIQISTDEVYGSILTGSFTEDSSINPRNPYSASKAGADRLAYSYFATHNVPVVVTRCSNNFGPNQYPEKFIPLFITNALEDKPLPLYGDGRYVRDWIYVDDHCAAIDYLIAHGTAGETYNLAGGNEVENIAIARRICQKLGKPESLIQLVKDRPGHDRRYSLDASKLAALGWRPQQKFEPALEATIDWYIQNPCWWQPIKSGAFKKYYQTQYGAASVKILLTGATGFIGSHTAHALLADGHEVYALVRPTSDPWRIIDIQSSLQLIQGDLLNREFELTGGTFNVCVHCAWFVEPGKYLESPWNKDYEDATLLLVNKLLKQGCRRHIMTGTCFEYDSSFRRPFVETSPVHPRSQYAASKLALLKSVEQLPVHLTWARLFYQYGLMEHPQRLVPLIINKLFQGQSTPPLQFHQACDYLHVTDVAAALAALVRAKVTGIVNVGSHHPVTPAQMGETIGKLMKRPELIEIDLTGSNNFAVADNTKLRSTGWTPKISLEAGLRQTVEWWKLQLARGMSTDQSH